MAFDGKVALITGGGSGMGRISAHRLADRGAQVAILDLNEVGLRGTAEGRSNVHPFVCDVSDADQVADVVQRVTDQLGPIDRLTHCAAIMPSSTIADMGSTGINRLMAINYGGTVNMVGSVLAPMLSRGSGQIILYGSTAGMIPAPKLGAYCATKAAVNMYAEVLIEETLGTGVQVLVVCPPIVNTPLLEQAQKSDKRNVPRSIQFGIEQGRMADPDDIVDAIEKGLEDGETILLPNDEAKMMVRMRRFVPGVLRRLVRLAENA